MADTLESGNEGSTSLATSPEQPKVDSVKSNQDKFAEKLASLRGKEPTKVEKSTTIDNSKQEEPERAVETNDTKPVKESSSDSKYKYTKEEGKIKGLERQKREREKRIADLEKELKQIKSGNSKTRDQYESDMEFIQDLSEKTAQEVALKREYERERSAKEIEEREEYHERMASQVKDVERHKQLVNKYMDDIEKDAVTMDYIMKSPVGIKVLDTIVNQFENVPGAKEEFDAMPAAEKQMLLVNIRKAVTKPEVSNEPKSDEPKRHKPLPSIAPVKSEKLSEPVDNKSRFEQKLSRVFSTRRR